MTNLIHRLEAAEGPSRELDALIWAEQDCRDVRWENNKALAKSRQAPFDECVLGEWIEWAKGEASFDCATHKPPIPAYTASLDAAVSLVPEGWRVHEFQEADDGRWRCRVVRAQGKGGDSETGGYWRATPALALCIAALKAREA